MADPHDLLAVINGNGEVWVHDITPNSTTIGAGTKLAGPGLFGAPDDQFVIAFLNTIAVVNRAGQVWFHGVGDQTIGPGSRLAGNLFGGPDNKYVVSGNTGQLNAIQVVTAEGDVWTHPLSANGVEPGRKLNGPSLFGGPNDRYVIGAYGGAILVINTRGEVWIHRLSSTAPLPHQEYDTVGPGYRLAGPTLFGAPNDRYVVWRSNYEGNGRLCVINSLGEVWARDTSWGLGEGYVGPGVKLDGPGLFGTPNDTKYVVYVPKVASASGW